MRESALPFCFLQLVQVSHLLGSSVPGLQIPSYSIFAIYEAFYGATMILMILMLIGNFVGEELYFRGYLMKKTAFLLIVPFLFFGLTMQLRKNLYTMIMFHLLFNIAGVQIYHVLLGLSGG